MACPHCSTGPSVRPKTCSHARTPSVPIVPVTTITTRRTGMSSGGALVPRDGASTPAVDDACSTGCTMATRSASVCGAGGANAGNDGKKSRDQKGFHTAILRLGRKQRPPESLRFGSAAPCKPHLILETRRIQLRALLALTYWRSRTGPLHPRGSAAVCSLGRSPKVD